MVSRKEFTDSVRRLRLEFPDKRLLEKAREVAMYVITDDIPKWFKEGGIFGCLNEKLYKERIDHIYTCDFFGDQDAFNKFLIDFYDDIFSDEEKGIVEKHYHVKD